MKKRGDELGAVLGNLRKERSEPEKVVVPQVVEKEPVSTLGPVPKTRESREAFTSRLRPSQRRWLKRWGGEVEEEINQRVTVEDILEALMSELQENEALQQRITAKLDRER